MLQRCLAIALFAAASSFALAQDVPLANWTVPPYRAQGGLTTMTDVTPGVGFVGVAPCRLVDTREAGYPAGYGAPALSPGVLRSFDLNSDPLCPGIPAGLDAYSLNVTVTQTAGPGHLVIYPQGGSQPLVSSINYVAGQTIANAVIVPAGTGGGVTVVAGVSATHLIIDINGYFTDQYNPGVSFHAVSSNAAPAILAENTSAGTNAVAVQAVITSASAGDFATAVYGRTNGNGYGVHGSSANGYGVLAGGGAGGVYATTDGAGSGVYGQNIGTGSPTYGVYGLSSPGNCCGGAGVLGVGPGGRIASNAGLTVGVRGESVGGYGVWGLTTPAAGAQFDRSGVAGTVRGPNPGDDLASGYLGLSVQVSGLNYGVFSHGNAAVQGALTVTGNFSSANKWFVEPHPYDPSKEIRYVSLEGPHAEVYFRGTAQVSRGVTRIDVPQDFRFVADPQTYSAVVTPLGAMATVAVLLQTPDGIVVQASRDVKVNYVVYAERAAVKNPNPITENVHFQPMGGLDAFSGMPESYKRLLVQNGTLNSDGTVNRETAQRLGWQIPEKPNPLTITSE